MIGFVLRVPPNVPLQIDDATQYWPLPLDPFNFIHIRCFSGRIRDWSELLRQAYVQLKPEGRIKPGGRIEISERRPSDALKSVVRMTPSHKTVRLGSGC